MDGREEGQEGIRNRWTAGPENGGVGDSGKKPETVQERVPVCPLAMVVVTHLCHTFLNTVTFPIVFLLSYKAETERRQVLCRQ